MNNDNSKCGSLKVRLMASVLMLMLASIVAAQDAESPKLLPMPDEVSTQLTELHEAIGARRASISELDELLSSTGGPIRVIYKARLDRA